MTAALPPARDVAATVASEGEPAGAVETTGVSETARRIESAPRPAETARGAAETARGTHGTSGGQQIARAFAAAREAGRIALVPYIVAGYPDAQTSLRIALGAIDAGAAILEVGLPYSDPLADGTTIQRASSVALRNGATFARSVELLSRIHAARPGIPLVPMAYVNHVLGGGDGSGRLHVLADTGVSGVILADLTPEEGDRVESAASDAGLALVYLVTPTTPRARRTEIATRSGGFLYAVSLVGVTGARRSLPADVGAFLNAVRIVSPIPVAVGFGVSRPDHVRRLAPLADGVVVASALVDALGPAGDDVAAMARLVRALQAATGSQPRGDDSRAETLTR